MNYLDQNYCGVLSLLLVVTILLVERQFFVFTEKSVGDWLLFPIIEKMRIKNSSQTVL